MADENDVASGCHCGIIHRLFFGFLESSLAAWLLFMLTCHTAGTLKVGELYKSKVTGSARLLLVLFSIYSQIGVGFIIKKI